MKKRLILVLIVFSFFITLVNADCQVKSSCDPSETYIFDVSSTFNAHVSESNPNYMKLCCSGLTGITSNVVNIGNCLGTPALLMSSSSNAHIAKVGMGTAQGGNYNQALCLTGTSTITCEYEEINPYNCDQGYFCLLEYMEVDGFEGTNAHVAQCGDIFYNKKICCSVEGGGGECLQPTTVCTSNEQCCDAGYGNPTVGFDQYCSYGQYEELNEGHCCKEGDYWNPDALPFPTCTSADPCYPGVCGYTTSQLQNFLNDPNCMKDSTATKGFWEACCMKNWYGTTGEYYYCPVTAI
ncbi:MAG: hypothetical protein ISS82_04425 [Nanoarchaeota archaeon]|nr:hypothetical protein [Nanoarchaeota archaeon]